MKRIFKIIMFATVYYYMLMASGTFTTNLIEEFTENEISRSILIYTYLLSAGLFPLAFVGAISRK